jgi:hypothetical protein
MGYTPLRNWRAPQLIGRGDHEISFLNLIRDSID